MHFGVTLTDYVTQGPEHYLRLYLEQRDELLQNLLDSRGPCDELECSVCSAPTPELYRCLNCTHTPLYCHSCIVSVHQRLPFHKIEKWNSSFFEAATLHSLGYVLHTGHNGNPCPSVLPDTSKLVIVSSSGIHTTNVSWCTCQGLSHSKQLMNLRFYPATRQHPQTAFTYEVLDHYLVDKTTCKATAHGFYEKLRLLTDPINGAKLPVSAQSYSGVVFL